MKEYNEAKRELDEVYRKGKADLAAKIRPIFHQKFKDFFKAYPEVELVSWDISDSIYDDENYNAGVEGIRVRLFDQYTTEEFREEVEGRYPYGWEDYIYTLEGEDYEEMWDSKDRLKVVLTALMEIGYFIHRMDIDFLQNVFEKDCKVTVTKEGFTVDVE